MKFSQAGNYFLEYHRAKSKKNTARAYEFIVGKFCQEFGDISIDEIPSDDVLSFLNRLTEGNNKLTRKNRYSQLSTFFNFIRYNIDEGFTNPCDVPVMKKMFRVKRSVHWDIIEKETVDEIIFRTMKARNRLMLELMARGGLRVGEVLKLTKADVQGGRKLILRNPKSGKDREYGFIPQKVADRLKEYTEQHCDSNKDRIFPISYEAARQMVMKSGKMVGIHLRPHDLRRHAATLSDPAFRSRS